MSVHIQTGNELDVVFTYNEQDKPVLLGLQQRHGGKIIPLPEPWGLVEVLQRFLEKEAKVPRT